MILENMFIRSIVIPIIFSILSAVLSWVTELVNGRADGDRKFLLWEWEESEGNKNLVSVGYQTAKSIKRRTNDPEDIAMMANLRTSNFVSLGIELSMASLLIDIISLLTLNGQDPSNDKVEILLIHFIVFACIIVCVAVSKSAKPNEEKLKRGFSIASIGLGILSMSSSFLVL